PQLIVAQLARVGKPDRSVEEILVADILLYLYVMRKPSKQAGHPSVPAPPRDSDRGFRVQRRGGLYEPYHGPVPPYAVLRHGPDERHHASVPRGAYAVAQLGQPPTR